MNSDDAYRSKAEIYDRCISPLLNHLRQDIRTYITYKGYRKIIDIGCGTGEQLRSLESPGMDLHGIDQSLAMLEQARKKSSDEIQYHLFNADQRFSDPGQFDTVILSFALHEMHPTVRESVFSKSRKLVRQGGALIVADFATAPSTFLGGILAKLVIPSIEKMAGTPHYLNFRNWMKQGGLEGFLETRREISDIISSRFNGNVLCCAIPVEDDKRKYNQSLALLNQTVASLPQTTRTRP